MATLSDNDVLMYITPFTMRCRYNAVNFLQHYHKMHPVARPDEVCDVFCG